MKINNIIHILLFWRAFFLNSAYDCIWLIWHAYLNSRFGVRWQYMMILFGSTEIPGNFVIWDIPIYLRHTYSDTVG